MCFFVLILLLLLVLAAGAPTFDKNEERGEGGDLKKQSAKVI